MPSWRRLPERWRRLLSGLLASSFVSAIALGTYAYFTLWACTATDRTTSTVVTAVSGGITGIGITVAIFQREEPRPAQEEQEEERPALLWLRKNRFGIPEDLALGSGDTVDELATALGIRPGNRQVFGALLRDHRLALFEVIRARELSGKAALEFFHRIGDLVAASPTLAPDFAAAKRAAARPEVAIP